RNAPFLVDQISIPPPDAPAWFISDEYVAKNNKNDSSLRPDSDARVTANSDAETTANSDYEPVTGTSNNPPKKYRTRNKSKKTNICNSKLVKKKVAQLAAFDMINTGRTTTFATGGSSNP
ncbi:28383_t:CDS:2, partial [Racocetra persica]